jgi:phage baseplate assembly protein W
VDLAFPYHIAGFGRTSTDSDHVRDLVYQVLFTAPGERVNRPDFGAGVGQLVFAPDGDETIAATQLLVQSALQQWLSELIQVEAVRVERRGGALEIVIQYVVHRTQETAVVQFRTD